MKYKVIILSVLAVILIVSIANTERQYTAEQIANLTLNDVTHILRTIVFPATIYQLPNRSYTLDQVFNMVYDSTNHALRISAVISSIAPDSAHEWPHAWIDTTLAKHYASKAGLALHFWMRGTRGDTLAKFSSKTNPVVIWFDTLGDAQFLGRVTSTADSTDTLTSSKFKLIGQYNYVPWCTSINTWGAKGFITGWYKDTLGMVGNPPLHVYYGGVSLRAKYWKNTGLAKEVWSIRAGGYKSNSDSTREAWRFPLAIVDPGDLGLNTDAFSHNGSQRIYWGTPFYWFKIDTVCTPDTVAWVDTSGQVHCRGIDLFPQASVPLDSHKVWASPETLWYNDKNGVPHGIYPSGGGGALVFGDINAYYASVASFGPGRDSVGGYYFSGSNAIQAAINAASTAATITNKKTVYVMEGVYAQNCSLKSNVNLVGSGMQVTVIKSGKGGNKIFTARGASNFTVRDLSVTCDSAIAENLNDSLVTEGCKNVLYYNFMMYSSPTLASNDMIGIIKMQSGDSVQFINCRFGLGTKTIAGYCCAAISATMTGGVLTMDKVTQTTTVQVYGMTIVKSGAAQVDIENSSFSCLNVVATAAVIFTENTDYLYWYDYFVNCSFYSNNGTAFLNNGTGYLAQIIVQGCSFNGTYTPSVAAQQQNHVSGNMFNVATNPMIQAGWGPITAYKTSIDWEGSAVGEITGFKHGSIDFDTVSGLSVAPHSGYMQYKTNGANDTLYLYADGAWHAVYPSSKGIADSARYLYGGISLPGTNRITIGFSNKNLIDAAGNHTWDIGSATNAPDTIFAGAVVGASDLHLYSAGTVQIQGAVAAIGSQGTFGAVASDIQKIYGLTIHYAPFLIDSSIRFWSAVDTSTFKLSNDTLSLTSAKASGFFDFRQYTVLFKSGWMLFDQLKPATNDSASSSLGSASVPYGSGYFRNLYSRMDSLAFGRTAIADTGTFAVDTTTWAFILSPIASRAAPTGMITFKGLTAANYPIFQRPAADTACYDNYQFVGIRKQ